MIALPLMVALGTMKLQHDAAHRKARPSEQEIACSVSNIAFQPGETITYKLYYNWNFVWLSAGEVTFRVKDHKDQYHISALGTTYKSYEWFFKVRDQYDSYVDKETLLPVVSVRDVEEGKYRLYDKVTFDHNRQTATSLRGKTRETAELAQYPVSSCVHDILSMIYYTRNMAFDDARPGKEMPVKIFMDKETWPLKIRYRGREANKKIKGLGRFDVLHISPEVIAGDIFEEGAEVNIWVSDDKNKLPLLIESPLSVGSVKAVLQDYKGLRHDLAAARD